MALHKNSIQTILLTLGLLGWCFHFLFTTTTSYAQDDEGEADNKLLELGLYLNNKKGGVVNVRIVENKFRIYFMDKDKNVVSSAFKNARLDVELFRNKTNEFSLYMKLSDDGLYLTSPRRINPSYHHWLRLVLLDPDNADNNQVWARIAFKQ